MMVYFNNTHLLIGLVSLVVVLIVLRIQKKSFSYLLFFTISWIYFIGAISVAVLPFVIITDHSNSVFHLSLNLTPFDFGNCFENIPRVCYQDMFNNVLLTVPFGFGIHFIIHVKPKYILWAILAIGCSFEFIQLVMTFVLRTSSRSIDINDVILNTTGAFIGYVLFKIFGWAYSAVIRKLQARPCYICADIYDVINNRSR
jgi:glycopeptide antibiotics resistance protein